MLKKVLTVTALSAALVFSVPQADAGAASEAFIEAAARDITATEPDAAAREIIDRIDVTRLSRFTLGSHGRRMSPDDLSRVESAMTDYIRRQVVDQSGILRGARVEVVSSTDRSETDSIVTTRVNVPGEEEQTVRWRVLRSGEDWRVVDVEVYGLWLAVEQRAQFDAILDRPGAGVDDLIRALR